MITVNEPTDIDRIADRLRVFLSDSPDAAGAVRNVARAGTGRSRDNWLFDIVTEQPDAVEPLILRTDPQGGLIATDRGVEFAVLQALETSGLPTPIARWLDKDGAVFGRPSLIMRRLPGACDYLVLRNETRPLSERRGLARELCELMSQVHSVDWKACGLGEVLTDPGPAAAQTELAAWTHILRQSALEPWPELEYAITVLGEHAPLAARTALIHADFKPGNVLLEGNQVTALLDWELAHLGDPMEDLGWVTQPLRAAEHTIVGAWEAQDLILHYELITGLPVNRAALAWWVAFSALKTAIMQLSGLRAFLEKRADQPYRPTRRVLLTVLDDVLKDLA